MAGRFNELHLSSDIALHVGPNEEVILTPLLWGKAGLGLDHSINSPNFEATKETETVERNTSMKALK